MKTISTREFQLHLKSYIDGFEDLTLTKRDKVVGYFLHELPDTKHIPTGTIPLDNIAGFPINTPVMAVITPTSTMPVENLDEISEVVNRWCELHFEAKKNYPCRMINYEDENGAVLVERKWTCPNCIEKYESMGKGRIYFL